MASIIAICKNQKCGTVFEVNNFIGGEGHAKIHLQIGSIGPCPVCKGMGEIPNGEYELKDSVLKFIKGNDESDEVLKRIKNILEKFKIQTNIHDKETVIKEVESVSPKIAELIKNMPSTSYFGWLNFIITIIGFYLTVQSFIQSSDDNEEKNIEKQFIEYLKEENNKLEQKNENYQFVYDSIINQNKNLRSNIDSLEMRKVGRNDPCICGKPIKYKKCCGNPKNQKDKK